MAEPVNTPPEDAAPDDAAPDDAAPEDAAPDDALSKSGSSESPEDVSKVPAAENVSSGRRLFTKVIDIALWLVVLGVVALALMPGKSGPNVGQAAASLELPSVGEGDEFRRIPGDLKRPLLIEAFASWCGACRRNAGILSDLAAAQREGHIDVVAVSVDDSPRKALQAKTQWPIPVNVLHDTRGEFAREYKVDVLPTYILIGVDGEVKRVTTGNPGASDIRAWLTESEE